MISTTIVIPIALFTAVGYGLVTTLLFLLLHKIKLLKISFLPLFIFSTIMYLAVTFLVGYFYIYNNVMPATQAPITATSAQAPVQVQTQTSIPAPAPAPAQAPTTTPTPAPEA